MTRTEDVRGLLHAELPRLVAAHGVPGASVALLVDGQTVEAAAGVVNTRTGVEATPDAVFMIQSITKVWTATLVMQLVDEGLVGLDAPVRAYLPGFRTGDEQVSAGITVRHLLTHTGGFEGDIWAATTSGEDALQRFVEDLVAHAPQHSRPGELFSYCSAGYGVLGRLVEVLRDMRLRAGVAPSPGRPLAIDELAFCADEALQFRTAIGHARSDRGRGPATTEGVGGDAAVQPRCRQPAGHVRPCAAGLRPDAPGRRARARRHPHLSQASARAMRERHLDKPAAVGASAGQGLGWMLSRRPGVVEHGGNTIGVDAMLQTVPEAGVAVAVLSNGGNAGGLIAESSTRCSSSLPRSRPPPSRRPPTQASELPSPRGTWVATRPAPTPTR